MNRSWAWKTCAAIALAVALTHSGRVCGEDAESTALINDVKSGPKEIEIEFRKDVVYGTGGGENLLLDLAMPKGLTQPVAGVIWIHGGAWQGGSKNEFEKLIRDSARSPGSAARRACRACPAP